MSVPTLAILVGALTLGTSDLDFLSLFEDLEFRVDSGPLEGGVVRYRLFIPEDNLDEQFPLIVWLHGYGDCGETNVSQLRWLDQLVFNAPRDRRRFPFYLLAVQCPCVNGLWFHQVSVLGEPASDDMLAMHYKVVQSLLAERRIDKNRIYLTGLSLGGTACWEFAKRYPDLFAAVAPLASEGSVSDGLDRLIHLPIWAFHSRDDAWTPPTGVRRTVDELARLNGSVDLTEVNTVSHDCWTLAFRDYHLLDWLLAQRRGESATWAPGTVPLRLRLQDELRRFTWWQLLAQFAVVALPLVLAWWALWRRTSVIAGQPT
ncbi:MAG: hypothetical protein KF708_11730 [Pirellulales bacterium]|nr:hypothetical protein [Pirellulales bacterium]